VRVLVEQGQAEILSDEFPITNYPPHPAKTWLLRKEVKSLADGYTPTCLAISHPLKFSRWVEVLRKQKYFDVDEFCSAELANQNLLKAENWEISSLKSLFERPISKLKCLYDMDLEPESEVGGYITWWESHLRSCNQHLKALRLPIFSISMSQYCKSPLRPPRDKKFVCRSSQNFDIIWMERRGEGIKRRDMTAFKFGKRPRRYDTLIRVWPSATSSREPLARVLRFRNFIMVCVRRWEWCMAVLMRQS
jgi:hypothetical protein